MPHQTLVKSLIDRGTLKTPAIINAFTEIDRNDFDPEPHRDQAYADAPLPIGAEQTISQASTVAFMLELLEPHAGQTILDVERAPDGQRHCSHKLRAHTAMFMA